MRTATAARRATSSLIRNEPFSSSAMPATAHRDPPSERGRTDCAYALPTGRLQHNPDPRTAVWLSPISCRASQKSGVAIDAARQPLRRPLEVAYRHVERVSIGHTSHICHGCPDSGIGLRLQVGSVRHRIRVRAVVLDQRTQHLDDRTRLSQRSGPHVDVLIVERPQRCKSSSLIGWHSHFTVLLGGAYDRPDESVQLLAPGSSAHLDNLVGKIINGDDPSMDGVLEVVGAVRDPVGPADDVALHGERWWPRPGVVA